MERGAAAGRTEATRQRTSLVTSQNQISIPAEERRRFHIHPGTELVWEEHDGELRVHGRPRAR